MKKTALLIITLIITQFAFSQRGYLGFHFGESTALGDFGSKDIKNKDAGFAKPGLMAEISFGYRLKSHFGIAASIRGQMHQTDDAAIAAQRAYEAPDTIWSAKSNAWGMTAIMVGPYASFQLTEKFSLDLRLLGGYSIAGCPTITYNYTANGKESWREQAGTKAPGFSYLAGAQIKFRLGELGVIMAGIDYYGSNIEFKDVEMSTYEGNKFPVTFKQPYSTLNYSIGLGFAFD